MGLLRPAMNQTAFLKAGILGFEGSGKTRTAVELALGITRLTNGKKVAFYDTETGSDFHIQRFKDHGIQLDVAKTRAFKDLLMTVREAEQNGYSALIIDSISHVWKELCSAYKARLNRKNGLYMQDWGNLKAEWQQFTDLYLNSKLHILMLGRAGYEYDMDENDETGKKEIVKVGTKMKVEGEMGYEPSLLIEMLRVRKSDEGDKDSKGFINRAVILKDRTDTMNGKTIDFPTFKDFMPVVKFLNLGGDHLGVDTSRSSEDMFDKPDWSASERQRRTEIALEEIKEALILKDLDGTSVDAKKGRTEVLMKVFGTSSWTAISSLRLDDLLDGVTRLKIELGLKKPDPDPTAEDCSFDSNNAPTRVDPKEDKSA